MTRITTSLETANSARAEWRNLARFLRRPQLPLADRPPIAGSLKAIGRLYVLDGLLMAALAAAAWLLVQGGLELPKNMLEDVEFTLVWIAAIVLGAPLIEELIFRSWISGRPGHVMAAAIILGAAGIAAFMGVSKTGEEAQAGVAAAVIGGGLLGLVPIIILRGRPPMVWFQRIFPVLFWLVTLAFGFMHLLNYQAASLLLLIPLALPQIVAGSIFGYVRVHHGLWAAILLHALHNGTAISVALLGERLAAG